MQEFEDLDEITARYVQPMAAFARDLLSHKYFQDCNGGDRKVGYLCLSPLYLAFCISYVRKNFDVCLVPKKMEELLIRTKKEKPTFIPYFVSACRDLPGKFLLGYQPRGKPR